MSVANVYEFIPLEHFSHDYIIEEEEEGGVYVDLPEHVYDRSFVKRTRANGNTNFYALVTELKNKKAKLCIFVSVKMSWISRNYRKKKRQRKEKEQGAVTAIG